MTKNEWQKIQDRLHNNASYRTVLIKCDQYVLQISTIFYKCKLKYYVSKINGKSSLPFTEADCEERKRFMSISTRSIFTMIRGKKLQKELISCGVTSKDKVVLHSPAWNSFNKLKKHLVENNKNIELLIN